MIARSSCRGYFIHSLSTLYYYNAPSLATRLTGDYRDRTFTGKCGPASLDTQYKKAAFGTQKRLGDIGFISNIIENHDEPRGVSHYIPEADVSDTSKKMLAAVNVMLRGLPFIYQGQELGMTNVAFHSINEIDDCSTLDEYQVALDAGLTPEAAFKAVVPYSRDNARTPFQWDATANAGFTTGTPWLKVNPNYTGINAAEQGRTARIPYITGIKN